MVEFNRNILKLISGSFLAQIIPLAAYPILTRLFSPEDFGSFATVMLFASLMAVIASGCYEHAILLTQSRLESAELLCYVLVRSLKINIFFLIVIWLLSEDLSVWLNNPALNELLLLAPVIGFAGVIFSCQSEWLVKYKNYVILSTNRVLQGLATVTFKVFMGINYMSTQAFLLGELFGRFFASLVAIAVLLGKDHSSFKKVSRTGMLQLKTRYSRFPKIMTSDQLLNIFGGSLHVLFIGPVFGAEQLGYVALLFSACYLPITVVTSSIKDVFRQQAHTDYLETGSCRPLFRTLLIRVALIGLPVFTVGYYISPYLFPFVFGEPWRIVGSYAQIMMPLYYFNLVSMSFAGVLIFTQNINMSLYWQIASTLLNAIALYIGCYVFGDVVVCLFLIATVRSVSYLLYILLAYYYSEDHEFKVRGKE